MHSNYSESYEGPIVSGIRGNVTNLGNRKGSYVGPTSPVSGALHQPSEVDYIPIFEISISAWHRSVGSKARLESTKIDS